GTGCGSAAVIHAAANVAWAFSGTERRAELCFTVPECNSMGLALMGGKSIEEAFAAASKGAVETAIVLENDLYRRAEQGVVDAFLRNVPHLVVIDHIPTTSMTNAELVLPAATFAEADGSLVSNEGRVQRFFRVIPPQGEIRESWRWIRDAISHAGRPEGSRWGTFDDIVASIQQALPSFSRIGAAAPPATFRIAGMKIARQTHRRSGRTAEAAHMGIREQAAPKDPDTPFSFSMEGYQGETPSSLIPRFWVPGWNSVQAVNAFQEEVGGPLRGGDPGVRLIEGQVPRKLPYFVDVPPRSEYSEDSFLLVPLYHVFGSEELSSWCPGISELAPSPYLALNAEDADRLGVEEKATLEISHTGGTLSLSLRIVPDLPLGVCGYPLGLTNVAWLHLPSRVRIQKPGENR
ncbi:MAG: molybdopterin-dependent oxidoreductase, partial [Thermodesulfobacteriota bacterium]